MFYNKLKALYDLLYELELQIQKKGIIYDMIFPKKNANIRLLSAYLLI